MNDLKIRNATAKGYVSVHRGGYSITNTRTARQGADVSRITAKLAQRYKQVTKF